MRLGWWALALALLTLFSLAPEVAEARPHNNNRRHKQRSRIDRAWQERRTQCDASAACSHLPEHPKLLCSLRCLSPNCYGKIYGSPADELEEGEIDSGRERSFEDCVRSEEKQRQDGAR